MQLISDIINDLVNQDISITVPLTKTKILATRIGNQQLLKWLNNELKGYDNKESLPDYRKTQGSVVADFINNNSMVINYPFQLPDFGEDLVSEMKEFLVFDSISTLEVNLKNENELMIIRYPDGVKASLEDILRNTNGPYFQLLNVGVSVPKQFLLQVLAVVKDRLLDFMLEIERQFGMETDLSTLKLNNTKVNNIYNTTINNSGNGNTINTGNNSRLDINQKPTGLDKDRLTAMLTSHYISLEDINQLLQIVDIGHMNSSGYNVAVNNWIKNMIGKALDGTWNINIGEAGKVLDEALKAYYH